MDISSYSHDSRTVIKNAQEIAATFKLADAQAVKIVRRITGRARFFRRAFDLMAAK